MAQKKEMLILSPRQELVFEGPFNHSICKNMVFSNPSKELRVAFKMKTTSPRMFFVRPNIGLIEPGMSQNIEIFMQPIVQSDLKKNRHKFLIQAAVAPSSDIDLQDFWKTLKSEHVWDAKIKCELVTTKFDEKSGERVEEPLRQAGGLDGECDNAAESSNMEKLLKKVSVLEEERFFLKQELKSMRKSNDEQAVAGGAAMMMQQPKMRRSLFYVVATIFTTAAAILGYIAGKYYM